MSTPKIEGDTRYSVEVVGESHYYQHLHHLAGRHGADGVKRYYTARLHLERNNPVDPNAVRVDIQGKPVGYLAREMAPQFRAAMAPLGISAGGSVEADALVAGGAAGKPFYGVYLDIPSSVLVTKKVIRQKTQVMAPTLAQPATRPWWKLKRVWLAFLLGIALLCAVATPRTQNDRTISPISTPVPIASPAP